MSSSSSIAEILGSPQAVFGFGATTTLLLLATTFFYLKKNNEGSSNSSGRGGEASSGSVLDKVEELDTQVSRGEECF